MTSALTIDDKINGYKVAPQQASEVEPKADERLPAEEEEAREVAAPGQEEGGGEPQSSEPAESEEPPIEEKASDSERPLDEYGNEVPKGRTYTEEEVQKMIKDRLLRGRHAKNPQQQVQRQEASEGFESDPNSNESWEAQLDAYIDRRLETRERNIQREQWEEEENSRQIEFESKFTTGMSKYQDFHDVVGKLPITDSIMMATREMKDPAAFLYAAAKTHPNEIGRIASLQNPIHQAAEIGRLEERMRKSRNISNSARPLSPSKSDFSSEKVVPKRSIDDLINKHAKSKVR